MVVHLRIDDALIKKAMQVGQHENKKEAVIAALKEYIQHHKQMEIIEVFGMFSYDPKYNYKRQRSRKY